MPTSSPHTAAVAAHAPGAAGVTYLFSDVEGSTRLWETDAARIGPALAWHDSLSRAAVERHGGTVVKMTGDGIHAAFDDPAAALAAVLDIQRALQGPAATGHTGGLALNLRCGLHTGHDQRRDNDFFGPAVNRAARIMQAAHGGQVLLSQAVAERVALRLPAGAALRDLGQVRLRDLTAPERVFQLVHPELRADFPALRSLASTPNNLAQQVNSFIGRERELAQVRAQLADPSIRLLTLLGMGGLGKSRLSLQVAAEVLDDFADGVWFIELAPLADPGAVVQAVASVLGVKEEAGSPLIDALLKYVRDKTLLVVLDNCEHVVQACAELARRLLQAAPRLKLLTSSRDALQIAGEHVVQVAPLAAPAADSAATPATLAAIDAVQLFIDRATAAQPAFRVTDRNAAAVADICRRLDGIPLALELAAARTRALSVEAIAARLNDRFKLLVTGDRTVLPRQRTLRALIDWSYDLLSAAEKTLFARLSVFAGGWTLEAAESVCAGGEVDAADVLDLQARLVEKSLVIADLEGGRYRMLETVREYAAGHLAAAPDLAAVRDRHLAHYLGFVEDVRPRLFGPEQAEWLPRLGLERQNVLAAHAWCDHAANGAQAGMRMCSALRVYWLEQGLLDEGLRFALAALARAPADAPDLNRGRTLYDAGQLSYAAGRYEDARRHLERSLAVFRAIGDRAREVLVLQLLGLALAGLGDVAAARRHGEEAVAVARQQANRHALGVSLGNLVQIRRVEGDLEGATALCDEALQLFCEQGDKLSASFALLNRAMVAVTQQDVAAAIDDARRALELAAGLGSPLVAQTALFVIASVAAARGQWSTAASFLAAADTQAQARGDRRDPADDAFIRALAARIAGALAPDEQAAARARSERLGFDLQVERAADWLAAAQ